MGEFLCDIVGLFWFSSDGEDEDIFVVFVYTSANQSLSHQIFVTLLYHRSVLTGGVGSILLAEFHWSTLFYSFGTMGIIWSFTVRVFLQNAKKHQIKIAKKDEVQKTQLNGHIVDVEDASGKKKAEISPIRQVLTKAPFW